jgi:hypothetical protein
MMSAWQIDAMWDADAAAEWERLHEPDPCEAQLMEAAKSLGLAIRHLSKVQDWVQTAADELADTPMADKAESYWDQVTGIKMDLQKLADLWQRGVRD